LDGQQETPIGEISVKDGKTIHWDEVGIFGSKIGSKWHGAKSALPSTSLDLLHFISSTGETIQLDINIIAQYVQQYNTQIENVQAMLRKIGSEVQLETFDGNEVNRRIVELQNDGRLILMELEQIETYTDIVSMSKFVLENMNNGGMNALLFGLLVIGILLVLHGTLPAVDIARTKKNLKKQIAFLQDQLDQTQDPRLTKMVNNVFPIIEKTELGQELLVQEGEYTPDQLYSYLNNYQKFGQVISGNRPATENIKNELKKKLEGYLTRKNIF
jgi:hypothetical protein